MHKGAPVAPHHTVPARAAGDAHWPPLRQDNVRAALREATVKCNKSGGRVTPAHLQAAFVSVSVHKGEVLVDLVAAVLTSATPDPVHVCACVYKRS